MVGDETWLAFDELHCVICGRVLDGDPDEDPTGDVGQPICGQCVRDREVYEVDASDGELDGRVGG